MPLHWKIGKYRESLKNGEKWTEKYQIEALQSVKNLFAEEVPENNIVCDISHFLHFADRAEADIPNHVYMPNIGGKWKRSKCRF